MFNKKAVTLTLSLAAIFLIQSNLMGGNMTKVFVSSVERNDQNLKGENTVDGNATSRWASEWSDPQWIYYDFGSPQSFDLITIKWETAHASHYEIQLSDDSQDWKTIYKEENGDGEEDVIYVGKQKSRYVRLYGLKRGTQWGYSIFEFKTEMRDDNSVPKTPASLHATMTEGMVLLEWPKSAESDFYGYNIYREGNEKEKFKKINLKPFKSPRYKDKNVTSDISYRYYVTAVDYAQNESPASPKVSASYKEQKRKFHSIPDSAWMRFVGDIPEKPKSGSPNRGIALGGFGAGSFMYNLSGSFGPFQTFDQVIYKGEWLSEAAFHLYEKKGQGKAQVKTLANDPHLKSGWDKIHLGDARYYALHPKGWVTYHSFQSDLSQKFFSPIIPNNYQQTSYPVAIFEFKLHNPTAEKIDLSVMLTFPGVFVGQNFKAEGFKNSFIEEGEIKGVVLQATNGIGEWCIAAKKVQGSEVSYLTSWNGEGDGGDVWQNFGDDGRLKNGTLDSSHKAAALAVKVTLQPGEEKEVPFVISWDFPVVKFGKGTQWWKKYTQHFSRGANNSFKIAQESLNGYKKWEEKIDGWMNPVLSNKNYPDWLKRTAFNELYYTQFGGSFYEAGLKSGHPHEYMNLHTEDNKFFEMECMMYPWANTFDVRHYSSLIFAYFWPQIEKEILVNWADSIVHFDPQNHQTPHDCGNPWEDPYFKWDGYGTNRFHWKDLHSKFIQQAWRYWYLYKDKKFLDYVWPACKATYDYMKKTDTNGDGLPDNEGSDNTYDAWGLYGTSLLCGGLWVGALESMREMAKVMGDPVESEVKEILSKARKNLDAQLWYGEKGYYRIDTKSKFPTAVMADGLNGQRYCEFYGLPDILPKEKMKLHLKEVYNRCVVPLHDFDGDGIGDCGAINGVKEDGTLLANGQSDEIWTGSTYFLAASMYRAGLKKEALQTARGVYRLTYEEESTAYWFNTPEAWMDRGYMPRPVNPEQYQRPRAVWELLMEIDDPYRKMLKK